MGREAVIHTSMGDIFVKLFTDDTPRTVENFCVSVALVDQLLLLVFLYRIFAE